jgi:hypothetical protein
LIMLERGEIMLYNGIDITVDLEVLRFGGTKIREMVRTKAMYVFTLASLHTV